MSDLLIFGKKLSPLFFLKKAAAIGRQKEKKKNGQISLYCDML